MLDILLKNRSIQYVPEKVKNNYLNNFKFINDIEYKKFIIDSNGGYFFKNSLHFYSFEDKFDYNSIIFLNNFIKKIYPKYSDNIFFIGEDIMGNLFGFENDSVIFFNIESAEKEIIATSFISFIKELLDDLEYFTGYSFIQDNIMEDKLAYGERLGAKFPFILGGNYDSDNFILKNTLENLDYCSSIANQINNLPDGTKVNINFK
ncbi:SMI1/KNR4 family protein [Empedobacter brevis]|uniref:SMI1/KNR4 family protein n=1 Tax=Empedobacter brevis TaxID=247 RepID=UPI0023F2CEC9|nr:SMI1/KNR4 family protein [Empedobacter brevis]